MEKHEMMSLEDSRQLRDKMRFFEHELLGNHHIDPNLYVEYDVKRGLRDSAGKGVLTGLTEISDVNGYKLVNGRRIPADGQLFYQGINVEDIVAGLNGRRYGFEEVIYLLIFGKLPNRDELARFFDVMGNMEELGGRFVRDVVMKGTNANIMNAMQRCVLALYTYDDNPEDISPENVLRQSLELIAKLPEIAVYSYHAYRHFRKDETLFIRNPQRGLSLAENILLMLRPDGQYTELEAKVQELLDAVHDGLFQRAKQNLEDHTKVCRTLDEVKSFMEGEGGFAKTMWCGNLACELAMKELAGVSSRCIPFNQEKISDVCPVCGKPAKHMVYWGVAY